MSKLGFDLNDFGGNVDLMLIKGTPDELATKPPVPELKGSTYVAVLDHAWSHLGQQGLADWRLAAEATSRSLKTRVIYFYYQDTVNWLGYQVFDSGEVVEDYSFGDNMDEDMIEMGVDPDAMRPAGTVSYVDNNDRQYLFRSSLRTLDAQDIGGGEAFIDAFLKEQQTYLGWDLFEA